VRVLNGLKAYPFNTVMPGNQMFRFYLNSEDVGTEVYGLHSDMNAIHGFSVCLEKDPDTNEPCFVYIMNTNTTLEKVTKIGRKHPFVDRVEEGNFPK
jgi:hypothetical protein